MSIYVTRQDDVPASRRSNGAEYGAIPISAANALLEAVAEPEAQTSGDEFAQLANQCNASGVPKGYALVSPKQQSVHRLFEFLAVASVPVFAYLAMNRRLPGWARLFAGVYVIATVVVDGGLLTTWAAKDKGETGPYSGWRR